MASSVTYQNISTKVTRKPWRVMSPDAEYQPLGDTKTLARYVTRCLPSASGDITRQGFRVAEGLIFWYSRPTRRDI